jgi:hypothetical protein
MMSEQYLLQQEVTADIDGDFKLVERAIQQDFLPTLFANPNVSEDEEIRIFECPEYIFLSLSTSSASID